MEKDEHNQSGGPSSVECPVCHAENPLEPEIQREGVLYCCYCGLELQLKQTGDTVTAVAEEDA